MLIAEIETIHSLFKFTLQNPSLAATTYRSLHLYCLPICLADISTSSSAAAPICRVAEREYRCGYLLYRIIVPCKGSFSLSLSVLYQVRF